MQQSVVAGDRIPSSQPGGGGKHQDATTHRASSNEHSTDKYGKAHRDNHKHAATHRDSDGLPSNEHSTDKYGKAHNATHRDSDGMSFNEHNIDKYDREHSGRYSGRASPYRHDRDSGGRQYNDVHLSDRDNAKHNRNGGRSSSPRRRRSRDKYEVAHSDRDDGVSTSRQRHRYSERDEQRELHPPRERERDKESSGRPERRSRKDRRYLGDRQRGSRRDGDGKGATSEQKTRRKFERDGEDTTLRTPDKSDRHQSPGGGKGIETDRASKEERYSGGKRDTYAQSTRRKSESGGDNDGSARVKRPQGDRDRPSRGDGIEGQVDDMGKKLDGGDERSGGVCEGYGRQRGGNDVGIEAYSLEYEAAAQRGGGGASKEKGEGRESGRHGRKRRDRIGESHTMGNSEKRPRSDDGNARGDNDAQSREGAERVHGSNRRRDTRKQRRRS